MRCNKVELVKNSYEVFFLDTECLVCFKCDTELLIDALTGEVFKLIGLVNSRLKKQKSKKKRKKKHD